MRECGSLDNLLARNPVKVLGYLVLAAFAVRFVYLSEYARSPFFWVPELDSAYNDNAAMAILHGHVSRAAYWRAPGYSYFLAGIYAVFGHSLVAARGIQMLLSSMSCGLLYWIGARTFRPMVALIAAIGMAFYGPYVFNDGELQSPALEVFLDLATLACAVAALASKDRPQWCAAGFLLGLSAIVRPSILIFVPIALAWLILSEARGQRRKAVLTGLVFVAVSLIAPMLATARNAIVAHDPVFIASQGGVNLFVGNHAGSDGFTPSTPKHYDYDGAYQDAIELYGQRAAGDATGHAMSASQVSAYWTAQAFDWWAAHPGDALKLFGKKLVLTFNHQELRDNIAFDYVRKEWCPVLWVSFASFGLIAPLGLLGIGLAFRTLSSPRGMLAVFALANMTAFAVFFAAERFRLPSVPILLLFAAYATVWLVETAVAARRAAERPLTARRSLAIASCTLIVLAVGVNRDWYRTVTPATWALDYWSAGNRYASLHHFPEADAQYAKALSLDPGNADIWLNRGTAAYYDGKFTQALPYFDKAVAIAPTPTAMRDRQLCAEAARGANVAKAGN